MGLTYFSKYRKTEGARRQSCQQLKVMTPNIDGKVTNVEKSVKFHHSLTNVFIACGSQLQHGQARFSLSLLRPLNDEKWAVFLPSGPGQHIPNLACCGRRTKKTWELLLLCSAEWQVSWLNTISMLKFPPCDWHLQKWLFSLPLLKNIVLWLKRTSTKSLQIELVTKYDTNDA